MFVSQHLYSGESPVENQIKFVKLVAFSILYEQKSCVGSRGLVKLLTLEQLSKFVITPGPVWLRRSPIRR